MSTPQSKITADLLPQTASADSERLVDVIIELASGTAEQRSVPALKESFGRTAAPVVAAISELGGEVTGEAWMNQTLRARVPAHGISELSSFNEVVLVDVPRSITPD